MVIMYYDNRRHNLNQIRVHKSGLMGEEPNEIPNNLMPYVTQVAAGKLKELGVLGNDYDTPDGIGILHPCSRFSLWSCKSIKENCGFKIYNLGTGNRYSVLDIVKNFEKATGITIPYIIKSRRLGDIATYYCDSPKVERKLGWKTKNGILNMCKDAWNGQSKNPNRYK